MALTRLSALLLVALAFASGCRKPQSQRCADVCQMESDCAEERGEKTGEPTPYDLEECTAACVSLERDRQGKKLVDEHIACAQKAGNSCEALMACQPMRNDTLVP